MSTKIKESFYGCAGDIKRILKRIRSLLAGLYYSALWKCSVNRRTKQCLNTQIRSEQVIISLTSFPARITTVHRTIETLLNQKDIKPDKVELWLAKEQFPNKEKDIPESLLKLISLGLEICWCNDLRSYKKLLPTLKQHPDCIIITTDDDAFYRRDLVKNLYNAYLKDQRNIYCNKATMFIPETVGYRIVTGGKHYYKNASYLNKLVGVAGVLYPPKTFNEEVFNLDTINKYAPTNDDIWFWFMAILNGVKIEVIPHNYPKPIEVFEKKGSPKLSDINDKEDGLFWVQFNNLLNYYNGIDTTLRKEFINQVIE